MEIFTRLNRYGRRQCKQPFSFKTRKNYFYLELRSQESTLLKKSKFTIAKIGSVILLPLALTFSMDFSAASTLSAGRFAAAVSSRHIASFERLMMPYFDAKSTGTLHSPDSKNIPRPSQGDLFMIARLWNRLSPRFKQVYLRSLSIPKGMRSYLSPGGNFEILFATAGVDSVDTTDRYGFSAEDWRKKTSGSNGVPDYVDEVAWGFDSAWSMEIDRFGFVHPLPFKESGHSSNAVKVIVRELDSTCSQGDYFCTGYYGVTTPCGPVSGTRSDKPVTLN
jgi:hypothetical protein